MIDEKRFEDVEKMVNAFWDRLNNIEEKLFKISEVLK